MVYRDYFQMLSAEEASQYQFKFCECCPLYGECELVEEYVRFRDNHPPIHKSQIPQTSGNIPSVRATVTRIGNKPIPVQSDVESADGPGTDNLSYDQGMLKDGLCIMSSRVCPIPCGRQRVTEGIGDHYKIKTEWNHDIVSGEADRWEPGQPVFISAQTGQGKNYFIENELIPYVEDLNYENNTEQRVLILSNRLALRQQIKNRLKGDDDADGGEDIIYHYKGYADVMTYQSLLKQEKKLKNKQSKAHSRYIYVICDEAHFFTSDAMFNPHTSEILSAIVRLFQDAVRVYMSATPYECLEYIIKYEDEYQYLLNFNKSQEKDKSHPMVFYHFQRDYSYLDVKSYSSMDELYELIVESVNNRREKWLIFIDNKTQELKVKEKLLAYERSYAEEHRGALLLNGGGNDTNADENPDKDKGPDKDEGPDKGKGSNEDQALVVSADSKANKSYVSLVLNEKLGANTYVLITTSVLDNGVNLTGINNIVVSDMAKVKCLQMVGRARVSGPYDQKTLYIKRFMDTEVDKQVRNFRKQRNAYHSYDLAYGEHKDPSQPRGSSERRFLEKYYDGDWKDREDAEHWFGRSIDKPRELYVNKIARSLLDRRIPQYQAIYDEMLEECRPAEDGTRQHIGQKYLEYQLSWFGKVYCEDDDMTFFDPEKAKERFIEFLESYAESADAIEGTEKMKEFQTQFARLHDIVYPRAVKDKKREYGYLKMNEILKERNLGYRLEGKPQVGPWTVIEFEWENEGSDPQ